VQYIGKVWLEKPCPLEDVGKKLGLFDTKQYGEDLIGYYRPEATDFGRAIILIHISWGELEMVEKIRVWGHLQTDLIDNERFEEEFSSKMLALQRKD